MPAHEWSLKVASDINPGRGKHIHTPNLCGGVWYLAFPSLAESPVCTCVSQSMPHEDSRHMSKITKSRITPKIPRLPLGLLTKSILLNPFGGDSSAMDGLALEAFGDTASLEKCLGAKLWYRCLAGPGVHPGGSWEHGALTGAWPYHWLVHDHHPCADDSQT